MVNGGLQEGDSPQFEIGKGQFCCFMGPQAKIRAELRIHENDLFLSIEDQKGHGDFFANLPIHSRNFLEAVFLGDVRALRG